jgi:RNA polymerase sigma-70 factor (ECF subfamily)
MNDFEQHRSLLRLHCYRLLGSAHDAEDMVQETFIRALRARDSLRDPRAERAWLHRIATNVCLDELARRPRRARGGEVGAPSDPSLPPEPRSPEIEWLDPIPSSWIVEDPGQRYAAKESVALAFVAALQTLTPSQRAVLLLRDVVGLSAEETAEALACSVSSANSALHRARVGLEEKVGPRADRAIETPIDREMLERYLRAWDSGDLAAIVSLLHEEATLSMPPSPTWISGRAAIEIFFVHRLSAALEKRELRGRIIEANGGLALAFHRGADFHAIHLVSSRDGRIAVIDHFMDPRTWEPFFAAGLPRSL